MEIDYDYWWLNQWRLEEYSEIVSITLSDGYKVITHTTLKNRYSVRKNF